MIMKKAQKVIISAIVCALISIPMASSIQAVDSASVSPDFIYQGYFSTGGSGSYEAAIAERLEEVLAHFDHVEKATVHFDPAQNHMQVKLYAENGQSISGKAQEAMMTLAKHSFQSDALQIEILIL